MKIYSIQDMWPLFEDMHNKINLSSDLYYKQNIISRTIWLSIRIDGEIKNGGISQLFWNLGNDFDFNCFTEALKNIGSTKGVELFNTFNEFLKSNPQASKSFFDDAYFGSGFDLKLKKLSNSLTNKIYKLNPSIEALLLKYAEENWANTGFQKSIEHLSFTEQKDEKELISNLNGALKSGNATTAKKILKELSTPNQASEYGFLPLLEIASWRTTNSKKKIELTELLLEYGADINIMDK